MRDRLETERLVLQVPDRAAADLVLDYYERNRVFLAEWESRRDNEFYTREFQAQQLETEAAEMERGSLVKYWLSKKGETGRVIGMVSFANIVRGAFWSCHLGYKLDKAEINQGYMTEALRAGIGMVFNEVKLHRIEANIMPRNIRSLRVAEKLGFYNEGLAYKYLKINVKWEDHIHMVLLNDLV